MSALVFILKKHVSVMFFQRHPENMGTILHRMVVLVGGARLNKGHEDRETARTKPPCYAGYLGVSNSRVPPWLSLRFQVDG